MKAQRSAASSQALWKVIKSVFFIIDYIFDAVFLFETHHFMKSFWCCQNTKFVVCKCEISIEGGKIKNWVWQWMFHIFLKNVIYMESQHEDFDHPWSW